VTVGSPLTRRAESGLPELLLNSFLFLPGMTCLIYVEPFYQFPVLKVLEAVKVKSLSCLACTFHHSLRSPVYLAHCSSGQRAEKDRIRMPNIKLNMQAQPLGIFSVNSIQLRRQLMLMSTFFFLSI
jgi:hypothetical protein